MELKIIRRSTPVLWTVLFILFTGTVRGADEPPKGNQRQGSQVLPLDELFASLDKNNDGKISGEEAAGTYAERFPKWDADGDASVTRLELHDYRLRFGINDDGTRTAGAGRRGPQRAVSTASILKEPTDWRLEILSIPPGFAPDIELSGSEEIRFASGMFDPASSNYFTCIISLLLDQEPKVGAAELKDFLEKYYRGLSASVGRQKGFSPDIAQMQAEVKPLPSDSDQTNRFAGSVIFFDSFSDGRKIKLNVEARVIPLTAMKKTCVIVLVSPSDYKKSTWKTLRAIGEKAAGNALGTQSSNAASVRGAESAQVPEKDLATPSASTVKWHPGHYAFVKFAELDPRHLYEGFRGIQKTYSWCTLEPEKNRYDFSAIRADLAFLGQQDKRLVIQVQTKTFGAGQNYCPGYLSSPDYGGGVYRTRWGSFNPIIWNEKVNQRLNALYAQLGKELDSEPFLEAVVIPESATTFETVDRERLHYTVDDYTRAVEAGMQAAKDAFPGTVVIQYVNMPPESIQSLADYSKRHGIGFGGPDIYPYDPVLTDPRRGVYRLYGPLSGIVPLAAAVQDNDYTQKASFRGPAGNTPVEKIYEFGRDKLHLNYIFWGTRPGFFEKVQAMLATPSFPNDPAGGLDSICPTSCCFPRSL